MYMYIYTRFDVLYCIFFPIRCVGAIAYDLLSQLFAWKISLSIQLACALVFRRFFFLCFSLSRRFLFLDATCSSFYSLYVVFQRYSPTSPLFLFPFLRRMLQSQSLFIFLHVFPFRIIRPRLIHLLFQHCYSTMFFMFIFFFYTSARISEDFIYIPLVPFIYFEIQNLNSDSSTLATAMAD